MLTSVEIEFLQVANISYSKILDPVSDIISMMESLMGGAIGETTGDQRECFKRIHAYSWGLHTLVMDVITALGIENAATRPAVLDRFNALKHPTLAALDNLSAGFDGPLNEEQHSVIGFALEAVHAIEHMMTNIWHYSLIRHNLLTYADDEFAGSVLLNKMQSELEGIKLTIPQSKFCVIGDEAHLSYAFGEIAHNIRRHAAVEQASVHLKEYGYRADITIYDKGRGFQIEGDSPFQPFWQADAADPGLGLGLYLARRHVEGSGGSIKMNSERHRGTLVRISIPTLP